MKRKRLTHEQVLEILKLYPDTSTSEIAELFGQLIYTIYKAASRYNVTKSEAFRNSAKSGRIQKGQRLSSDTEFVKGHTPFTKGKKRSEYVKAKNDNSIPTRWQKGNKPHTTKADGDITIRVINGKKYKFIRLDENKWELLHRYLWSKINGVIPVGFNAVFKDGDTLNCNIDNIECISDSDLAVRNSGAINLPDAQVAFYLSGGSRVDKILSKTILANHPELIELKRSQILLNRKIKEQNGSN